MSRGGYRGRGMFRGRGGRVRRQYYDDREPRQEGEEGEERPYRKDYGERGYSRGRGGYQNGTFFRNNKKDPDDDFQMVVDRHHHGYNRPRGGYHDENGNFVRGGMRGRGGRGNWRGRGGGYGPEDGFYGQRRHQER